MPFESQRHSSGTQHQGLRNVLQFRLCLFAMNDILVASESIKLNANASFSHRLMQSILLEPSKRISSRGRVMPDKRT